MLKRNLFKIIISSCCISALPFCLILSTSNSQKKLVTNSISVSSTNRTYACDIKSKWFPYGFTGQLSDIFCAFDSFGQIQFTYNSDVVKNAIDNQVIKTNTVIDFGKLSRIGIITNEDDNLKVVNVSVHVWEKDPPPYVTTSAYLAGDFSFMEKNKISVPFEYWSHTSHSTRMDYTFKLDYIWTGLGFVFNANGMVIACAYESASLIYHDMYYVDLDDIGSFYLAWHK